MRTKFSARSQRRRRAAISRLPTARNWASFGFMSTYDQRVVDRIIAEHRGQFDRRRIAVERAGVDENQIEIISQIGQRGTPAALRFDRRGFSRRPHQGQQRQSLAGRFDQRFAQRHRSIENLFATDFGREAQLRGQVRMSEVQIDEHNPQASQAGHVRERQQQRSPPFASGTPGNQQRSPALLAARRQQSNRGL